MGIYLADAFDNLLLLHEIEDAALLDPIPVVRRLSRRSFQGKSNRVARMPRSIFKTSTSVPDFRAFPAERSRTSA